MDSIFGKPVLLKQKSSYEDTWTVLGSEECRWSSVNPENSKANIKGPIQSSALEDDFDFPQQVTRRSAVKRISHVRN